MKSKYGIPYKTMGVYLIENKVNGKKYIGSSVKITHRLSNHFNRECRKFPNKELYKDIIEFGFENFETKVLEECTRENLISRELYYYNLIKPEYNVIEPCENNFKNDNFRQLAIEGTRKNHNLKEKYDCDEYKVLFRTMHSDRMRPVEQLVNDILVCEFISIRDAARWCDNNTDFKAKNKASKIKSVCDGERKTAFGYTWRYKKV